MPTIPKEEKRVFQFYFGASDCISDDLLDRIITTVGLLPTGDFAMPCDENGKANITKMPRRGALRELLSHSFSRWEILVEQQADDGLLKFTARELVDEFETIAKKAKELSKAIGGGPENDTDEIDHQIIVGLMAGAALNLHEKPKTKKKKKKKTKQIAAKPLEPRVRFHYAVKEVRWLQKIAKIAAGLEKKKGKIPKGETFKGKDHALNTLIVDLAKDFLDIYERPPTNRQGEGFQDFLLICVEELYGRIETAEEQQKVLSLIYKHAAPHLKVDRREKT